MPAYNLRGVTVEFPYDAYECQLVYMEKVMAAFAAFEATVNGLPSPDDPDRDQVRSLQDELRAALDSLPATGSASPSVVERV